MVKGFLAVLACAAAFAPTLASAGGDEHAGTILLGNPATTRVGGITETVAPCDDASPLNGIDGMWIAVPVAPTVIVTPTGPTGAAADFDLWFYDANCDGLFDESPAEMGIGTAESGTVPAAARWVIVDLAVGAGASFQLTFS